MKKGHRILFYNRQIFDDITTHTKLHIRVQNKNKTNLQTINGENFFSGGISTFKGISLDNRATSRTM